MNPILLITPAFTQLNTPYPATCYLKGFLNTKNIPSYQIDLGIEVILKLFTSTYLQHIFEKTKIEKIETENAKRIFTLQEKYIESVDLVITFLQGKNNTLAHKILQKDFLPKASRFEILKNNDWIFDNGNITDQAKHLATLYLEDLADFIKECIDPHFGFSRYAEQLGRSANTFDLIYEELQKPTTIVDDISISIVENYLLKTEIVAFSVPFPGNLLNAFKIAQYIKNKHPHIKTLMGGGFVNTELRSLKEKKVFQFFDFISLDDGETPIENIIEYLQNKRPIDLLKRTFVLEKNEVVYINGSLQRDYLQHEVGTPDYRDLPLDKYIHAIEINNPMHRLWSNGRWNKLTMAHGCYWRKCTFCDVSLDYIQNYQSNTATVICDKIEQLIEQTNETGFHFVDEAAPPALMRDLALEIIKRKITITWWANIRFEKSFTNDLCYLLQKSGCIAVSGGLEVASNRLLQLINKGVNVEQVAVVLKNFKQNNIMAHAYLMYGYPTQTEQETIDSLEIVRQLFLQGIMQSGYWHRFALTIHSPIGKTPTQYGLTITSKEGSFANNDLTYIEKNKTQHELFSEGLQKSLYNYMQHNCIDKPLQFWFEHKVPNTSVEKNYIETILNNSQFTNYKSNHQFYFLGIIPTISFFTKSKKGNQWQMALLNFITESEHSELTVSEEQGKWLINILTMLKEKSLTFQELKNHFETEIMNDDFELFWYNKAIKTLNNCGLVGV